MTTGSNGKLFYVGGVKNKKRQALKNKKLRKKEKRDET